MLKVGDYYRWYEDINCPNNCSHGLWHGDVNSKYKIIKVSESSITIKTEKGYTVITNPLSFKRNFILVSERKQYPIP